MITERNQTPCPLIPSPQDLVYCFATPLIWLILPRKAGLDWGLARQLRCFGPMQQRLSTQRSQISALSGAAAPPVAFLVSAGSRIAVPAGSSPLAVITPAGMIIVDLDRGCA